MFTRLQVEGGFLHGLDLNLTAGLNVLIGARGTGKTSIIELIRFCLGLSGYTTAVERRANDHARSVLGRGEVILTVRDEDGKLHQVVRGGDEEEPRRPDAANARQAIVLAQNEIERVGLDKGGRLRLLDGFVPSLTSVRTREKEALSAVASVTSQIAAVVEEIRGIERRIDEAATVNADLAQRLADTPGLPPDVEMERLQAQLQQLDAAVARDRERARVMNVASERVARWRDQIEATAESAPGRSTWPEIEALGLSFASTENDLVEAINRLQSAASMTSQAAARLYQGAEGALSGLESTEEQARELRAILETRREGAGRHAQLLARQAQVRSESQTFEAMLAARRTEAMALQGRRSELLDALDAIRVERYAARQEAADFLNNRLGPTVHVDVGRLGLYDEYAGAIASALRGSGIQYSKLAGDIAEKLTPRELCDAVEVGDVSAVAGAISIPEERAGRLVDALRETGTGDILSAPVEDSVDLFLLDGRDYKRTDELSTGQRCTIVLPILLCHQEVTILIDQPEDHLDNAFVVETVIDTLRHRAPAAQFVFATHNANIPVLGEADNVVLMESDGQRGFVRSAGPLEAASTRDAVSRVMEGGMQAFDRRAEFYAQGI